MPHKSKYKIQPSNIDKSSRLIKPKNIDCDDKISFNFRRLAVGSDKFAYNSKEVHYFIKLVERLRDVSCMSRMEMMKQRGNGLRCHPIDFRDPNVTENSFGLGEDIGDDAWQFQLSTNAYGRVHGYFIASVFYIVWLDPEHNLYK